MAGTIFWLLIVAFGFLLIGGLIYKSWKAASYERTCCYSSIPLFWRSRELAQDYSPGPIDSLWDELLYGEKAKD